MQIGRFDVLKRKNDVQINFRQIPILSTLVFTKWKAKIYSWSLHLKLVMFCTVWLFVSLDIVSQRNKISYLHDLQPFYVTNPTNQLTHNRHYMFNHCFDSLSFYQYSLSLVTLFWLIWSFWIGSWHLCEHLGRSAYIFGGNIKGKWKK